MNMTKKGHYLFYWFVILGLLVGIGISKRNRTISQEIYMELVERGNVTLVFYKDGCPYCKAGKDSVQNASRESSYPTVWIDVETDTGKELAVQYGIYHAASIVAIREGQPQEAIRYATKVDGQIIANNTAIKEIFEKGEED